jgi:DNA (cytosine-5)-methyltransferase 1
MRHGSLFSGIGGFDLAAEWMGWENVFHCEWNEFGQKVLKYYWPEAESFTDITKTDFTKYANTIDILTGGFPCQPYSQAGKRLGKEDDRHLWPEMLRAIREIKPSWVVGENVYGLVNWSGGLVFHEVQADLEAQGYEVFPFLLPACGVNAPHQRYRIWFVAYSKPCADSRNTRGISKEANQKNTRGEEPNTTSEQQVQLPTQPNSVFGNASNTKCERLEGHGRCQEISRQSNKQSNICTQKNSITNWNKWPTVAPICTRNDGLSSRLDSITFPKWRNESIKAGGNAIVPQVVYQIFKTIEQYEHERTSH